MRLISLSWLISICNLGLESFSDLAYSSLIVKPKLSSFRVVNNVFYSADLVQLMMELFSVHHLMEL